MTLAIGDVLTRQDGHRFRLCGVSDGDWVGEPLDTFGAPVPLTADELAAGFGVEPEAAPSADEEAGWLALADAAREADERAQAGIDPGRSPEQAFAAEAEPEAKPKRGRKRVGLDADQVRALGGKP